MNLFQKPIDSAIQLAKTASKSCSTRKTIGCFVETIGCLYQQTTNKLNLKSQRQRGCTQLFILVHSKLQLHPVFSETLRIFTEQSPLDHLHHNQENNLETPQETHSPWPTLRLLILNTSRTHSQSQQTQKRIVQHITKITLVTDEYLKSIQVESYSSTLINHKNS